MNQTYYQTLPKEFIKRRRLVWLPLGLMYASYYMCRYNMPIALKNIGDTFHWNCEQLGWIITAMFWSYAIGQLINGLITDKIGGRMGMIIGAIGTCILNILMGFGAYAGFLTYFIIVWGLNGYIQAFGAPAMVKVNAQWFKLSERGTFTGIFGFVIQLGRWSITLLGGYLIVKYPWSYVFWIPSVLTILIAIFGYFTIKDQPEDIGFLPVEQPSPEDSGKTNILFVLNKVLKSKVLWIIAGAYFTTGIVRHGLDQWFIKYLQEGQHIKTDSSIFGLAATGIPIAAVMGSFAAGIISDKLFQARRGPVAALMYFGQLLFLILFYFFSSSAIIAVIFLIILQFFVNGPHSLLGGAAAMDFGGRKAAGFAAGLIDSFQYIGAGLTGFGVGRIIDKFGWQGWILSLISFAFIGGVFMLTIWNQKAPKN